MKFLRLRSKKRTRYWTLSLFQSICYVFLMFSFTTVHDSCLGIIRWLKSNSHFIYLGGENNLKLAFVFLPTRRKHRGGDKSARCKEARHIRQRLWIEPLDKRADHAMDRRSYWSFFHITRVYGRTYGWRRTDRLSSCPYSPLIFPIVWRTVIPFSSVNLSTTFFVKYATHQIALVR